MDFPQIYEEKSTLYQSSMKYECMASLTVKFDQIFPSLFFCLTSLIEMLA